LEKQPWFRFMDAEWFIWVEAEISRYEYGVVYNIENTSKR
jgi:hypothetical protein